MPNSRVSSNPSIAKRACDACHRRKVKCLGDGTQACNNCSTTGLICTYNAVPQKKGPKGSRAKVLHELRETQGSCHTALPEHLHIDQPHESLFLRRSGLLTMEIIVACLDYYYVNLYPTQPILHRHTIGETIHKMDTNIEAYCLVVSLCAYMMIQPNMLLPTECYKGLECSPQSNLHLGRLLVQETVKVRKGYDYVECPTDSAVITSFFLFGSYFCLDLHNKAWFHLREATSLAVMLGMHVEAHYTILDNSESDRLRRLYWLLFVTERAYAIQRHRPLTLHSTIDLPTLDHQDPTEAVLLNGFLQMVKLFKPLDDTFMGLWNKSSRSGCTTAWVAQLQQEISTALPAYLQCTESQAADLQCSQQWLRTMVWQLTMSHGLLSSTAAESGLAFRFPIEVSRDLVASSVRHEQQSLEIHGIGLVEKLFDMACTLTDVMACVSYEQNGLGLGPRDYLNQLMTLISTLRGGQQRYTPLLLAKISESVPSLSSLGYPSPSLFECSQASSSSNTSGASSPLHSPPLSAGGHHMLSYHPMDMASASASFPMDVTSGVQYPATVVSAPGRSSQGPAAHGYQVPVSTW